jgi:hypothetical protein
MEPLHLRVDGMTILELYKAEKQETDGPRVRIELATLPPAALVQIDGYIRVPVLNNFKLGVSVVVDSVGFQANAKANFFGLANVAVTIGWGWNIVQPNLQVGFTEPVVIKAGTTTLLTLYGVNKDNSININKGPYMSIGVTQAHASGQINVPLLGVTNTANIIMDMNDGVTVTTTTSFFGMAGTRFEFGWNFGDTPGLHYSSTSTFDTAGIVTNILSKIDDIVNDAKGSMCKALQRGQEIASQGLSTVCAFVADSLTAEDGDENWRNDIKSTCEDILQETVRSFFEVAKIALLVVQTAISVLIDAAIAIANGAAAMFSIEKITFGGSITTGSGSIQTGVKFTLFGTTHEMDIMLDTVSADSLDGIINGLWPQVLKQASKLDTLADDALASLTEATSTDDNVVADIITCISDVVDGKGTDGCDKLLTKIKDDTETLFSDVADFWEVDDSSDGQMDTCTNLGYVSAAAAAEAKNKQKHGEICKDNADCKSDECTTVRTIPGPTLKKCRSGKWKSEEDCLYGDAGDAECASGNCKKPSDWTRNDGKCSKTLADGQSCEKHKECSSRWCKETSADVMVSVKVCTAKLADDSVCSAVTEGVECLSDACVMVSSSKTMCRPDDFFPNGHECSIAELKSSCKSAYCDASKGSKCGDTIKAEEAVEAVVEMTGKAVKVAGNLLKAIGIDVDKFAKDVENFANEVKDMVCEECKKETEAKEREAKRKKAEASRKYSTQKQKEKQKAREHREEKKKKVVVFEKTKKAKKQVEERHKEKRRREQEEKHKLWKEQIDKRRLEERNKEKAREDAHKHSQIQRDLDEKLLVEERYEAALKGKSDFLDNWETHFKGDNAYTLGTRKFDEHHAEEVFPQLQPVVIAELQVEKEKEIFKKVMYATPTCRSFGFEQQLQKATDKRNACFTLDEAKVDEHCKHMASPPSWNFEDHDKKRIRLCRRAESSKSDKQIQCSSTTTKSKGDIEMDKQLCTKATKKFNHYALECNKRKACDKAREACAAEEKKVKDATAWDDASEEFRVIVPDGLTKPDGNKGKGDVKACDEACNNCDVCSGGNDRYTRTSKVVDVCMKYCTAPIGGSMKMNINGVLALRNREGRCNSKGEDCGSNYANCYQQRVAISSDMKKGHAKKKGCTLKSEWGTSNTNECKFHSIWAEDGSANVDLPSKMHRFNIYVGNRWEEGPEEWGPASLVQTHKHCLGDKQKNKNFDNPYSDQYKNDKYTHCFDRQIRSACTIPQKKTEIIFPCQEEFKRRPPDVPCTIKEKDTKVTCLTKQPDLIESGTCVQYETQTIPIGECKPGYRSVPNSADCVQNANFMCHPRVELSGGNDHSAKNLKACIGECDSDAQCADGLKCFQRENGENIPGCKGNGGGKTWDYCYDPSVNPKQNECTKKYEFVALHKDMCYCFNDVTLLPLITAGQELEAEINNTSQCDYPCLRDGYQTDLQTGTSQKVGYPKPVRGFLPSGVQYSSPEVRWPATARHQKKDVSLSRWQTCGGDYALTVYQAASMDERTNEVNVLVPMTAAVNEKKNIYDSSRDHEDAKIAKLGADLKTQRKKELDAENDAWKIYKDKLVRADEERDYYYCCRNQVPARGVLKLTTCTNTGEVKYCKKKHSFGFCESWGTKTCWYNSYGGTKCDKNKHPDKKCKSPIRFGGIEILIGYYTLVSEPDFKCSCPGKPTCCSNPDLYSTCEWTGQYTHKNKKRWVFPDFCEYPGKRDGAAQSPKQQAGNARENGNHFWNSNSINPKYKVFNDKGELIHWNSKDNRNTLESHKYTTEKFMYETYDGTHDDLKYEGFCPRGSGKTLLDCPNDRSDGSTRGKGLDTISTANAPVQPASQAENDRKDKDARQKSLQVCHIPACRVTNREPCAAGTNTCGACKSGLFEDQRQKCIKPMN